MHYWTEIKNRFFPRPAMARRLARYVGHFKASSGSYSWTPAELRMMREAETRLLSPARKVAALARANILAKIGGGA